MKVLNLVLILVGLQVAFAGQFVSAAADPFPQTWTCKPKNSVPDVSSADVITVYKRATGIGFWGYRVTSEIHRSSSHVQGAQNNCVAELLNLKGKFCRYPLMDWKTGSGETLWLWIDDRSAAPVAIEAGANVVKLRCSEEQN